MIAAEAYIKCRADAARCPVAKMNGGVTYCARYVPSGWMRCRYDFNRPTAGRAVSAETDETRDRNRVYAASGCGENRGTSAPFTGAFTTNRASDALPQKSDTPLALGGVTLRRDASEGVADHRPPVAGIRTRAHSLSSAISASEGHCRAADAGRRIRHFILHAFAGLILASSPAAACPSLCAGGSDPSAGEAVTTSGECLASGAVAHPSSQDEAVIFDGENVVCKMKFFDGYAGRNWTYPVVRRALNGLMSKVGHEARYRKNVAYKIEEVA